ncbi:MAG: FAD-binding protein [Candidatus Binatia bacterium]
MRIVVCVKYVPVLSALRFDPETRRLVREGVPGEVSGFDLRALGAATALRDRHGGEVVALTMGPPAARDGLIVCLALGADRAVHVMDPAVAGSDTLATARVLAAALRREAPDLVMVGRASTDAETGQVGPEVAELLGLPQATGVRRIALDPSAAMFDAERETDDGYETVRVPLPALVTTAEDIAEERFPTKAERQAAAEKPVAMVTLADLGVDAALVGASGSPTWVAGVEQVNVTRRAEVIEGDSPQAQVRLLGDRLRALGALTAAADDRPSLPETPPRSGRAIWVVVELAGRDLRAVTRELLGKAAELVARLGGPVEAVVIGSGAEHARELAAAGADRVLVAEGPSLVPYTTDAHATVLADAIRAGRPRLVLMGSTARGRDLAPRVAGRLALGLTGDAIDLEVDGEGRVRQMKPAFGGTIVAPILSKTSPEMATVRPGMLRAARANPARPTVVDQLVVREVPPRVRVVHEAPPADASAGDLDTASLVLGVGRGVGGPDGVAAVLALAQSLGAAVAATREVTDAGWLPRQRQVGLTGRAIAPRLYVGLGVSGAMEHMVGLRRAGTIVAINKSPKAPVLKVADLGLVADVHAVLPLLEAALRG